MFAARKEFELLKLLATDKKALATARLVASAPSVLNRNRPHPQSLLVMGRLYYAATYGVTPSRLVVMLRA